MVISFFIAEDSCGAAAGLATRALRGFGCLVGVGLAFCDTAGFGVEADFVGDIFVGEAVAGFEGAGERFAMGFFAAAVLTADVLVDVFLGAVDRLAVFLAAVFLAGFLAAVRPDAGFAVFFTGRFFGVAFFRETGFRFAAVFRRVLPAARLAIGTS